MVEGSNQTKIESSEKPGNEDTHSIKGLEVKTEYHELWNYSVRAKQMCELRLKTRKETKDTEKKKTYHVKIII